MNGAEVLDVGRDALWLTIQLCAPVLIVGLIVGVGIGLQLSAPVVVFSLVFNVATGLVGRVMPQFQVFFVASPIMVLGGLSIFAMSLGTIGIVWVDRYRDLLGAFGG